MYACLFLHRPSSQPKSLYRDTVFLAGDKFPVIHGVLEGHRFHSMIQVAHVSLFRAQHRGEKKIGRSAVGFIRNTDWLTSSAAEAGRNLLFHDEL